MAQLSSDPSRLSYIDALRGYAILFVIGAHCMFFYGDLPEWVRTFYPGGGVQLFFVVSAVALLGSWHRRMDGAMPFYIRRVFRLGPIWWLAIIYWLMAAGMAPRYSAPAGLTGLDILLNVTLLHGTTPTSINGLVPGGWSIAAEAIFYIFFPILAEHITTLRRAVLAFGVTMAFSELATWLGHRYIVAPDIIKAGLIDYWFPHQLPVFIAGFTAFFMMRDYPLRPKLAGAIVVLALIYVLLLPIIHFPARAVIWAYAIGWAALAYGLSQGGGAVLVNRMVVFVGTISYSAYFWHFIFLGSPVDEPGRSGGLAACGVLLALTLAKTLPASWLTHRFIEEPGITFGAGLARRKS